ncbi:MAG: hypothetical protein ABI067_10920 [Leifsonia sp.]
MSVTHAPELVSVWCENGRPARLVWRGIRYIVTDTPTPLAEPVVHDALTHPGRRISGWRFQGSSVSDRDTRMFDVRVGADGRWELAAIYS